MRRRADTRHCWERLTEHCHNAFFLSHTTQSQLLSTNTQIHKYTDHKYKYTKAQILNDRTLPQCFLSLTHHPVTTPPSAQLVKEPVCTESRNTVIFKWVLYPTNIALVGNLFIMFWKSIWYSQWQMFHIAMQKVWVPMIKACPFGIAPCLRNVSNMIFTNRQVSVLFSQVSQHFNPLWPGMPSDYVCLEAGWKDTDKNILFHTNTTQEQNKEWRWCFWWRCWWATECFF